MDTTKAANTPLWTLAAGALGAVSLAVNLAGRRRKRRWKANPDPLSGRVPHFPAGTVRLVETDDGAEIHTVRAGSGPPIVLLHGLTASCDDWGPVAERLVSRGFEVIGIDQRGHGHSTLGRAPYSTLRLAHDLAAVITALDLRNAVLVGHSMGGMAVQTLAVEHPDLVTERVRGLALISTTARLNTIRHRITTPMAARLPVPVPGLLADSPLVLGSVALSAFGPEPSLFMLRQAVASFVRCPSRTRQVATAGLIGFDLIDRLATITVPTLVLAGTRDMIVPFSESEQIATAIPGATLVPVGGAGHLVLWERPGELAHQIATHAGVTQDRT